MDEIGNARHPILIVEDELFSGLDVAEQLEALGYVVYGPISNLKSARQVIEMYSFKVAILDYQLQDGTSLELAKTLIERNVPVVFYTGNPASIANLIPEATVLAKPAQIEQIVDAISKVAPLTTVEDNERHRA